MILNIRTLGALMALSSCSFAMSGVDPAWDGKQQPECAESYAPVLVDGFAATSISGAIAKIVEDDEIPLDKGLVAGAILISLIYTVSAISGASKYNECRFAKADWYVREAIRESNAKAGVAPSSPATPSSSLASTTVAGHAATTVPAGYFCTSSPSGPELKLCRRERIACEQAREALAVPGSEHCAPLDVVWCFNIHEKLRCFATQHACEAQIGTATAASSACSERP